MVCDEIESYNDSPSELIYDEFEGLLFGGHPLGRGILGRADRLRTFGSADVLAFARRHYLPGRAVFFAYGDVDFGRLVRMLRKATADFPPGEPLPARSAVPLPPYEPREAHSDRATHQAHVMMGARAYCAHDSRRMALYLLNNILGGPGMNARLNLALRERNGLVYTVESSMASYSDTGTWCVYFGCDPHDVARCRRLVARELDLVAQRPLSAAQLAAAKKQIKGQIAVACDNRESFALDFGKTYLHYGREKDPAELFRPHRRHHRWRHTAGGAGDVRARGHDHAHIPQRAVALTCICAARTRQRAAACRTVARRDSERGRSGLPNELFGRPERPLSACRTPRCATCCGPGR